MWRFNIVFQFTCTATTFQKPTLEWDKIKERENHVAFYHFFFVNSSAQQKLLEAYTWIRYNNREGKPTFFLWVNLRNKNCTSAFPPRPFPEITWRFRLFCEETFPPKPSPQTIWHFQLQWTREKTMWPFNIFWTEFDLLSNWSKAMDLRHEEGGDDPNSGHHRLGAAKMESKHRIKTVGFLGSQNKSTNTQLPFQDFAGQLVDGKVPPPNLGW